LFAAGFVAALTLFACGGEDTQSDPVSKEDYIASANASCVEAEAGAGTAFERIIGEGKPTPGEAQRVLQAAVVPSIRTGLAEREALPAPDGDEEAIAAINAAGREALAGFEEIASDPAKAQALMLGELPDPAVEVDRLNRGYGVEECAGGN